MATSAIKKQVSLTDVSSGTYESTRIEPYTNSTVKNITLQPGTWLVLSYLQLSESGTGVYNHTLHCSENWESTVRSTEYNGGGSVNYAVIRVPEGDTKVVGVRAYVETQCYVNGLYALIKLK